MAQGRGRSQSPRLRKTWPRGGHPAPAPESALAPATYAAASSVGPCDAALIITDAELAAACKDFELRWL